MQQIRNHHLIKTTGLAFILACAVTGLQAQSFFINCGGASNTFTSADGQQWSTDRYYSPSDMRYTSRTVANTKDQYLYRTARAGLYGDFQYNIPVANGAYSVTLKLAEIQYWNKGYRVFNVVLNGAKVLSNFDILSEVPAFTALDKTFPVTVTNGVINIKFLGVVRRGIINSIQITPITGTAPTTTTNPPANTTTTNAPATTSTVTISVNPASTSIVAGKTVQFAATVGGTGNTAVTWTASAGSISASGLYTAPSVTQAATATVKATSAANTAASATATVSVQPPPAPVAGDNAGRVLLAKNSTGAWDPYVTSGSSSMQSFIANHFQRSVVFSPFFNSMTSWYPGGLVYLDSYAVYNGGTNFDVNVQATHPDWVLKDSSGNSLFIPWGCSGGSCPQYAADVSNPAYRQFWIDGAKRVLAGGNYKGVFMDDVNFDWRVSDGWGNQVTPWDRNTNAPMTVENWRKYFAEFLEEVKQQLPNYEICHNSIWYAGGDNGRDSDPYIHRQILASDDVYIEFGINDGGLTGGTGSWSVDAVLAYVERVNALGKSVVISGLAGGNASDKVGLEFGVAGYLLVNNGKNYAGDPSMVADPNNWWPGFDVNLGTPTGSRYSWNGLQRRDFSGGMVLMNYPGNPTTTVSLPGPFRRADGSVVYSVTLGAKQGAILVK